MSDLSNLIVIIMHTRYQYISPVLDAFGLRWHLSTPRFCGEDVPPQFPLTMLGDTPLQSLPVLNGPCAIKHGDPRVILPNVPFHAVRDIGTLHPA
jgi:hypothetical protein